MDRRKLTKQGIYGLFFVAGLAIIFSLIYLAFLQPTASCFDNKKNQGEAEVDCGGPCADCELRRLKPVRALPSLTPSTANGARSTLIIQLQNPNANYGVNPLTYRVNLYAADGGVIYTTDVGSFVYAGEITYRVEPNLPVNAARVVRSEVVIGEQEWIKRSDFIAPVFQSRDVRVEYDGAKSQVVVTGIMKNDTPAALPRVGLSAIVYKTQGEVAGASKTVLDDIRPLEERTFTIAIPVVGIEKTEDIASPRIVFEAKR